MISRGSSTSSDSNIVNLPNKLSKECIEPALESLPILTPFEAVKQKERDQAKGKASQREMNNNSNQRCTVQTYKIVSVSSDSGEDQVKTSPCHTPATSSAQMRDARRTQFAGEADPSTPEG